MTPPVWSSPAESQWTDTCSILSAGALLGPIDSGNDNLMGWSRRDCFGAGTLKPAQNACSVYLVCGQVKDPQLLCATGVASLSRGGVRVAWGLFSQLLLLCSTLYYPLLSLVCLKVALHARSSSSFLVWQVHVWLVLTAFLFSFPFLFLFFSFLFFCTFFISSLYLFSLPMNASTLVLYCLAILQGL